MGKASDNISQEAVLFGMGLNSDTKDIIKQLFLHTQKQNPEMFKIILFRINS